MCNSSSRNKPLDHAEEIVYLGDIVNGSGSKMSNISSRVARGKGLIADIFNILENICFGPHFFEIALLLRRTILVSSVIHNSSVWNALSPKELSELNKIDQTFFTRLCKLPQTATFISFFLEFGEMELIMYIKTRRIMYFFSLANRKKDQAVYIFFMTQYHQRSNTSWVTQVLQDFKDLKIDSNFDDLTNISV